MNPTGSNRPIRADADHTEGKIGTASQTVTPDIGSTVTGPALTGGVGGPSADAPLHRALPSTAFARLNDGYRPANESAPSKNP